MSDLYRQLPAVDALLRDARIASLPHRVAVETIRVVLEEIRQGIAAGTVEVLPEVAALVMARARILIEGRLRPVINATGVVIHTNLGRAPWSAEAIDAAKRAAGYCNLELDLPTGQRGGRLDAISQLFGHLVGSEQAIVVNNCAAAVLLALTALARGREVIVSRGELIEIGGSFRVPDVVSSGGAQLVEVGTTNRTRIGDYEGAITSDTAVMMRAHPSNFRVVGFTEAVTIEDLARLGQEHGIPVVDDQGCGSLAGARGTPSIRRAVAAGVDVVVFSGDKLLGGPQAGYCVGRASVISRLRKHPLYRALRVDKTILAACEATLIAHIRNLPTPVSCMIDAGADALRERAETLQRLLQAREVTCQVIAGTSWVGGGALPGEGLESYIVRVPVEGESRVAQRLRVGEPAVVVRVADESLRLDVRTLLDEQLEVVAMAVANALADG